MDLRGRMAVFAGLALLTLAAACGSSSPPGWGAPGGGAGAGSGGGLVTPGSSGGGASPGSGSGGSSGTGLVLRDAGGGSSDASTSGQPCTGVGTTRVCFCTGKQTCNATTAGEFTSGTWGPCLDGAGGTMTSCPPPVAPTCGNLHEGPDAGCDSGPPPPPPPPPALCTDPVVSTEPQILVGYQPAMGQTVGPAGQIKVWVCDENSPFIAPGEMVDNMTGAVTAPGNRTATAADGLLYEPALYIAPQTPTNGGTPHFPQLIKGSYNSNPPTRGTFTGGAPIDPVPPGSAPPPPTGFGGFGGFGGCSYNAEYVWDVATLGLVPGSYTAVFSVHDGDRDRAIGCVNIVITK
jgi:hypothetical protein